MSSNCPAAPGAPSSALSLRELILSAGTQLFRFHGTAYPANAFNPNRGRRIELPEDGSRFNPFPGHPATNIPTLYAAETFQSAALESVFHDVEHVASPTYLKSRFASWHYSGLAPFRDLTVFELVNPFLRQLSVPGRRASLHEHELVHTPSSEYPNTRTWAQFLHASWPALDGLAWRPRLGGNGLAFVFFGDRCGTGFSVVSGPVAATSHGGLSSLGRVAAKASIRLI